MIQRRDKKRTASAKRIQAAFLEENHIDIEEIPPKEEYVRDTVNKQLRVCAYCRVSTDEESQQSSYELQVQHYTEYININVYSLQKDQFLFSVCAFGTIFFESPSFQ